MPAEKVSQACNRLRAPKPKRERSEKQARLSALLERLVDANGSLQSRARAAPAPNALHRNPSAPAESAASGHQSDSYSRKPQAPMKSPLRQRADADCSDVPDADSDLMDTDTATATATATGTTTTNGAADSVASAPTRKRAHPEAHPLNEVDGEGADAAAGGASYAKRARIGTPFKTLSMTALAGVLTSREQLSHYYTTPISDEVVTGSHLPESFIFRPSVEVRDARRRAVSRGTSRRLALNPNSRAEFAAGASGGSGASATLPRATRAARANNPFTSNGHMGSQAVRQKTPAAGNHQQNATRKSPLELKQAALAVNGHASDSPAAAQNGPEAAANGTSRRPSK